MHGECHTSMRTISNEIERLRDAKRRPELRSDQEWQQADESCHGRMAGRRRNQRVRAAIMRPLGGEWPPTRREHQGRVLRVERGPRRIERRRAGSRQR
jgi:hypothetical protein